MNLINYTKFAMALAVAAFSLVVAVANLISALLDAPIIAQVLPLISFAASIIFVFAYVDDANKLIKKSKGYSS